MNIKQLKNSPMFNLSLSSKELFHSNFLDWLIQVEQNEMSKVFSRLIHQDISDIKCDREKNNFDLYINGAENKKIIIENKFKSIITEQQLKKYHEKLIDTDSINILLSLNLTAYERNLCAKYGWKAMNYSDLCKELEKITISNKYHASIVEDYCSFINEVSSYFLAKDYSNHTIEDMYGEYKKLLEIRLHDIYQKILFNYLLRELNILLDKDNKEYANGHVFSKKISSWQDFWRGTGLVSLNYTIKEGKDNRSGFRLELQLQYNALKLMLIHDNPKKELRDKFRDEYFMIIEKLANTPFCRTKGEIYPNRKNMDYKKYGSNLIYKSIILSDELTMKQIINLMYKTFLEVVAFGKSWEDKN